VTLFGERIFTEVIKLKMKSASWALIQDDWALEMGNLDTSVHTGRMPNENEGRGQGDVSTMQEMPKIASKPPEAGGEARTGSSFVALSLDLRLPASTSVRQFISTV
jgi:hypothetical protein